MNQPDYTSHIIAHKACSPQMHPSANALVIMLRPLLHTPFT